MNEPTTKSFGSWLMDKVINSVTSTIYKTIMLPKTVMDLQLKHMRERYTYRRNADAIDIIMSFVFSLVVLTAIPAGVAALFSSNPRAAVGVVVGLSVVIHLLYGALLWVRWMRILYEIEQRTPPK